MKLYINLLISIFIFISCQEHSVKVIPQKRSDSCYYFNFSSFYFEIDPLHGARITSVKWDKNELLFTNKKTNGFGSTFWPAPQTAWVWPPLEEIDSKPYQIKINGNKLILTSGIDKRTKLQITKEFEMNPADTSMRIMYSIKNCGQAIQYWAPWEITRVPCNGYILFPQGQSQPTGKLAKNLKNIHGYFWYSQDSTTSAPDAYKFVSDSRGWIASINQTKMLLVKVFEDISPNQFAPDEGEIEVYTHADHTFSEVENLGAYQTIHPGKTICWQVKWYIRQCEPTIVINSENDKLIKRIEDIVKKPMQ